MVWEPDSAAPRDVNRLAAYLDEQLAELSRRLDTFKIFREVYTPTWTHNQSTDPVLGNGTLVGSAVRFGNVAIAHINLQIGSTTTFEAAPSPGEWRFSLPWACEGDLTEYIGAAMILDTGTVRYVGAAQVVSGDSFVRVTPDNSGVFVRSNVPMTWANGDTLGISIMYVVRD